MEITTKTKLLGIFGDPIAHTLSPAIQNAALTELGIDMLYLPFHVAPESLKEAVETVRTLNMAGVNITIPHKEAVIEFLDELSDDARAMGAVNTIVNDAGKLIGHNTDGAGYLLSLTDETAFNPAGKNIVILGAGGAARGILFALLKSAPASVTVANRSPERAEELIKELSTVAPEVELSFAPMEKAALLPVIETTDLVVNTTSLGMAGKPPFNTLTLSFDKLKKSAIVSDIVYKPFDTALLKAARSNGAATHRGLGMLICQGALGFELWTGKKAPLEVMRLAAFKALDIDPKRYETK